MLLQTLSCRQFGFRHFVVRYLGLGQNLAAPTKKCHKRIGATANERLARNVVAKVEPKHFFEQPVPESQIRNQTKKLARLFQQKKFCYL
jgi:hypothetical protein